MRLDTDPWNLHMRVDYADRWAALEEVYESGGSGNRSAMVDRGFYVYMAVSGGEGEGEGEEWGQGYYGRVDGGVDGVFHVFRLPFYC